MKFWVLFAVAQAATWGRDNTREILPKGSQSKVHFESLLQEQTSSLLKVNFSSFIVSSQFRGPKSLLDKLASASDPKNGLSSSSFPAFLPTFNTEILAWMEATRMMATRMEATSISNLQQRTLHAFQEFYRLSANDIDAILTWTSFVQTVDVLNLPIALSKLPAYVGIGIRYTRLDEKTIATLDSALLSGKVISLDEFILNERFINAVDNTKERLAAFSPAGFPDLFGEYIPEHPYRIVAKLKTGRYITPVGIEQEVVVYSGFSQGFRVIAFGIRNDGIPIYFLEEADPLPRSKL